MRVSTVTEHSSKIRTYATVVQGGSVLEQISFEFLTHGMTWHDDDDMNMMRANSIRQIIFVSKINKYHLSVAVTSANDESENREPTLTMSTDKFGRKLKRRKAFNFPRGYTTTHRTKTTATTTSTVATCVCLSSTSPFPLV